MLFSDDTIAKYVSNNFESTWQNVREVPIVTIDFGNGNVITRTLNGNIATYACTADGQVLDILPGIYEPETYLRQLDQFAKLHRWAHQQGKDPHETMRSYHQRQSETLAKGQTALVLRVPLAVTKARIEGGVKLALYPGLPKSDETPRDVTQPRVGSTKDLARWNLLAEDTRVNESVRRLEIHRQLAEGKAVTPSAITKWLYREVLDADIDDPYLGLGKTLFASYPFKDH